MSNPFSNVEKVNAIIRVRRGPEVDRNDTIYDNGELIYSTDKKRLFVGDSEDNGITGTVGGILVGNKVWVTNNFEKLSGILPYDLVYRTDSSPTIGTGFYLLTGSNYLRPDNYILINTALKSTGGTTASYVLPAATSTTLGGVIVKDGLTVTNGFVRVNIDDSTIKIDPATNKLYAVNSGGGGSGTTSTATENTLGVVKVPSDGGIKVSNGSITLNIDNTSVKLSSTGTGSKLYVDPTQINIPIANYSTLGRIRVGEGLSATNAGVLNLRYASETNLGGIRIGTGLVIDENDGMLSVDGTIYDSTPIGTVCWFAASSAPTGFLECSGGLVTVEDYPLLASIIGATYNTGLSSQYYNSSNVLTSFRVPDLRGEFIRGWDDGRGVDSGRLFGSGQKGTIIGYDQENDAVWHVTTTSSVVGSSTQITIGVDDYNVSDYTGVRISGVGRDSSDDLKGDTTNSGSYTGITRPRNVALLPCIKATKTVNGLDITFDDYIQKPASSNQGDILVYDEYGNWISGSVFSIIPRATEFVPGLITVGSGLSADTGGKVDVKIATTTDIGGVILGDGLSANPTTGKIDVVASFSQIASPSNLGGVKVGTGLSATNDGTLNLKEASSTELGGIVLGSGLFKDPSTGKVNVASGGGSVPTGAIMMFPSLTIPSGWLSCNGQELDNTVIANLNLFGLIGYTYGGTGNKFNVPDLRGLFVRGLDDNKGIDPGRTLGTVQQDELKSHTHLIQAFANGSGTGSTGPFVEGAYNRATSATGGTETRPKNLALVYCIKL